jgi:oligopeptide transport system ATP-binding protein
MKMTVQSRDHVLLRVENIQKYFGKRSRFRKVNRVVHAVEDVSFEVPRGEGLGLVGESGSGKSTIARCVLCLERVDRGLIYLDGRELTRLGSRPLRDVRPSMQAVFQDPASSLNPRWEIRQVIEEPLRVYGWGKVKREQRVLEVIQQVGLSPRYLNVLPHQLSGGQQQRAGIARALVLNPKLIVADEPLSALDVSIQAQVLNVLVGLKSRLHLSYLFISHDLRVTRHLCENIAVCYLGNIVEVGPGDELSTNPRHPYTAALVSAMPLSLADARQQRERIVLAGDPPSPLDPPSGCRFHTRCFRAGAQCAESTPRLEPVGAAHRTACFFPLEPGYLRDRGAGSSERVG